MSIVKARLRDAPALAWVAAQAFAAENTTRNFRRRAVFVYSFHLLSVLVTVTQEQMWHWDRKALIGIGHQGSRSYLRSAAIAATGFLTFLVVDLVLLLWLSISDARERVAMLLGVVLVLAPFVLAVFQALKELHLGLALANGDAIRRWKKTLPGRTFYRSSYLAMYPQTGEGLTFARAAIEQTVSEGAALYTEVRSTKHRVVYARAGLHPLLGKNGTPTLALGVSTA